MSAPVELPRCVFVAGPTASGKTSLAVELAISLGAEVVSADSMLVYRHLDIGTAKPTEEEKRGVLHHLIDVVDPDQGYDAARFRDDALEVLSDLTRRGVPAIVAGGTGLYLRSLRSGLAEAPSADLEYRARLEDRAAREGSAVLHAELASVDPDTAEAVHPNDLVRIQRALEIHRATGRPASEIRAEHGFREPSVDALYLVLELPREILRRRIEHRARQMAQGGLVEEVRRLDSMGYGAELRPMMALNYRHAHAHIAGEYDIEGMVEKMTTDTWHFAKRQNRWFRSEPDARFVSPDGGELLEACRAHLRR